MGGAGSHRHGGHPGCLLPRPPGGYTCLPTCSETDGKFLHISNAGMATFAGEKVVAWVRVPGDYTSFKLEIFDGDSGKDNAGNLNWRDGNWDENTTEATYTLYADPLMDGSGMQIVGQWGGNTDNMPNNAWFTIEQNVIAEAQGPSSHYFYRLEVTQPIESRGGNTFKLRSNAYLSMGRSDLTGTSIALMGMVATPLDVPILYPQFAGDYNNPGPSNYSGDWALSFYVPDDQQTLCFWDGDFDRGSSPTVDQDTDDANTIGKPEFATAFAVDERAGLKGVPADDAPYPLTRRSPAVKYEIIAPDGATLYSNDEPSGTEEWEKFVISSDTTAEADLNIDSLQAGFHVVHVQGLDLHNLVFFRVNFDVCDPVAGCGPPPWTGGHCALPVSYWLRNVERVLIKNKTTNVQETRQSLEWALRNTALASPILRSGINVNAPAAIADPNRLSDQEAYNILRKANGNSLMDKTLMQLLAAWMNVASGKVGPDIKIHMNMPSGPFEGTVLEALRQAETIILDGGDLARARDLALGINNGGTLALYEEMVLPPALPAAPTYVPEPPPDPATCGARVNTYGIESPTNNPFYGIKFEYQSGTEIRDGNYDLFTIVLPADVVNGLTAIPLEAKAATEVGQVTVEGCQFNSALPCGDPLFDGAHNFAFQFTGATDNGDGTYTLSFTVQVMIANALSHVTIGLPDGVIPSSPSGTYQSQVCPTP